MAAFVKEVKAGLSYRQFLSVLFLAGVENGDPHQVAQVFGAHRISSDARIEERLLPLFWVLDRIKSEPTENPPFKPFEGNLPRADQAAAIFQEAMLKSDKVQAEQAVLALSRDRGARFAMSRLWEFAGRNIGGNLGHPAIALANSLRALEAMGWQHAEVALRYAARYIAGYEGDSTYAPNLERVKQALPALPLDWAGRESQRAPTVELYQLLREGNVTESCEFICSSLVSGKVKAGSIWDAISLAACDSLFRYQTGGEILGGVQIHAITTTNALRFGFNVVDDTRTKLINLLQAAGVTADFYVGRSKKEGHLRNVSLLDLQKSDAKGGCTMRDVFERLPFKAKGYNQTDQAEREASDQACRMAFELLADARNEAAFTQTARSLLCVKPSLDPHDIKFPAAVFEDAYAVSAEWRPYLLASSVHALHGTRSDDTPVLRQVREAFSKR